MAPSLPGIAISIIIVNWNTRALLADCLTSIAASTIQHPISSIEILVIDNASTDGSAGMVRERFPRVRLIENGENVGFARANNQAIALAQGQHLLLLNPDTVITQGAITQLWQVLAAYPAAGIAGAQLLNADGSLQMSCDVFPSLWTELPVINRRLRPTRRVILVSTPIESLTVQSVDWVSGACLMIKRKVVQDIGPLDESFWLYTEETDWCYRARVAGWDVLLVPQARIYHLARAASRQRFAATMLHFYQSRVRFIRKHRGPVQACLAQGVLRAKAAVWHRRPGASPLHVAYPDLTDDQIRTAYRKMEQAMKMPLQTFLANTWR